MSNRNEREYLESLRQLSKSDWSKAGWPIVTSIPQEAHFSLEESESSTNTQFWKEVFNPKNFISLNNIDSHNPNTHSLLILHSLKNKDGKEEIFKAIFTPLEMFRKDISNVLKYNFHGKPCEIRSKTEYPIPDKTWREIYINKEFLNRK